MTSDLRAIHFDIGDYLRADPALADATVVNVLPRATTADEVLSAKLAVIEAALADKGLALIVLPPRLKLASPNIPGPRMVATHTLQVVENPLVNRADGGAGLLWEEVVERLLQLLHQYTPTGTANLIAAAEAVEDLPGEMLDQGLLGAQVTVTHDHNLLPLAKVATPTITVAGTVTLACATSGAAIYYTINGTFPYVGNTAAALYAAPFAKPTAGLTVRAAAFKASHAGSDVAEQAIT